MPFIGREIAELKRIHALIKQDIERKLLTFRELWEKGSEQDLFAELSFCLLTPQSKAEACWNAVKHMVKKGSLFTGSVEDLLVDVKGIRFGYKKALYIVGARELFTNNGNLRIKDVLASMSDPYEMRDYLVNKVKGMGYKEASHFLRNIGVGESFAILDRHVISMMVELGMANEIPKSLSRKRYLSWEERLRLFSSEISMPLAHLDFVFWYRRTGRIFK